MLAWLRAIVVSYETVAVGLVTVVFVFWERPFAVVGKNLQEAKGIGGLVLAAVLAAAVGGGFKIMNEIVSEPGDKERPLQKWSGFFDLRRRVFIGFSGVGGGLLVLLSVPFLAGLLGDAWIGYLAVAAGVWILIAGGSTVWAYFEVKSTFSGAR